MTDKKASPINRALQRDLLLLMRDKYPGTLIEEPQVPDISSDYLKANLWYLQEHGLCDSGLVKYGDGGFAWSGATINERGLDFLEDDGGLSAILNVITIKIHADTLRDILNAQLDAAPGTKEEKSAIKQSLASLPDAALKAGTSDLVQAALQHIPNAVELVRAIFGILKRSVRAFRAK